MAGGERVHTWGPGPTDGPSPSTASGTAEHGDVLQAALLLRARGFASVVMLDGGLYAWPYDLENV